MLCHACPGMTDDTCSTVEGCGDPRENAKLREWFERALGIPILQGDETVEATITNRNNPVVVVEEA